MTKIDYYKYIKSEAWFKRTENVRKRNKGICELCCMRIGTCVHHRTYKHLGCELDEELVHVCEPCHRLIHNKEKKGEKVFIWPSRKEFLKVLQNEVKYL